MILGDGSPDQPMHQAGIHFFTVARRLREFLSDSLAGLIGVTGFAKPTLGGGGRRSVSHVQRDAIGETSIFLHLRESANKKKQTFLILIHIPITEVG